MSVFESTTRPSINQLVPAAYLRRERDCMDVTCRVLRADNQWGTGFLIARQLIITNNHVLPDKFTCKGAKAQFYYEEDRTPIEVDLDQESLFFTSKSPGPEADLTETCLDFTIVALRTIPESNELGDIYARSLSIFKEVIPARQEDEAFIIQHPKEVKKDASPNAYKKITRGVTKVIQVIRFSVHYDTKTDKGSSGGPVLNEKRQVYAIHRVGNCKKHTTCSQGVTIKAVVNFLSTEKDENGIVYLESIKKWIYNKETPKYAVAVYDFENAQKYEKLASSFFRPRAKRSPRIDRKETRENLKKAIVSYDAALKAYGQPSDTVLKAEVKKIQEKIELLLWQQMQVVKQEYLALYLPSSEDQVNPAFDLLNEPEEHIDTLREWVQFQEVQLKKDLFSLTNPTLHFLLAFIYEFVCRDTQKSAEWYFSLAQTYSRNKGNLFIIRACLDKAEELYPTIHEKPEFQQLNIAVQVKEKEISKKFHECLADIKRLSEDSTPFCYILYDKELSTKDWITKHLYGDLERVGACPLFDEKRDSNIPIFRFADAGINDADFILILCTPSLVKKNEQDNSIVKMEIDLYMNRLLDVDGKKDSSDKDLGKFKDIFLIREGNFSEAHPTLFTKPKSAFILVDPLSNYYFNSLKIFKEIKSLNEVDIELLQAGLRDDEGTANIYQKFANEGNKFAQQKLSELISRLQQLQSKTSPKINVSAVEAGAIVEGSIISSPVQVGTYIFNTAIAKNPGATAIRIFPSEDDPDIQENLKKWLDACGVLEKPSKVVEWQKKINQKEYVEQAIKRYEKVAIKGSKVAAEALGWCYENGVGVEKDNRQARWWYKFIKERAPQNPRDLAKLKKSTDSSLARLPSSVYQELEFQNQISDEGDFIPKKIIDLSQNLHNLHRVVSVRKEKQHRTRIPSIRVHPRPAQAKGLLQKESIEFPHPVSHVDSSFPKQIKDLTSSRSVSIGPHHYSSLRKKPTHATSTRREIARISAPVLMPSHGILAKKSEAERDSTNFQLS